MPNDELTRSQYIAALLNQKKTYNASGGNLVNPSISGLAELDTSFAGVQPVANPKQQEKADVSEQSGFDKFMNNVLGFVDEIAAKFGAGFVGGWEGGLDFIANGIGAIGDWTGWYNSKPFTDWAKQDIGATAAEWSKTAFGLGAWYNRFRNWDWNEEEWSDIAKGFGDLNKAAFFAKNDLGNARDISDKHYKSNDEVLSEMNIGDFKAGEFLGGIANSIGFMLPAIMTAGGAGAAGAGQTAVKATSLLTLGLGAAGKGSEEALNEGATAGQALGYGAASGAVEVVSEIAVGGILDKMGLGVNKVAGAVGGKTSWSALSKSGKRELVKEIAKTAFEEGAEEVFSAVLEPVTKSIYKGTDAYKDSGGNFIYSSAEYWLGKGGNFNESVLGQFASGAITGGLMGGGTETKLYKKLGEKGYLAIKAYGNFTEALGEVREAGKKYGTDSEQYKKAVEKASKEIVEFEELSKEFDENKLNYIANLLNNPQALERALQKDAQEKTNANVKQFIQNVVKEGKNISASVFRNTFNELQNKLGTDVELVLEEGAKNQYDSKNNTITLNTSVLETEGGQKLVHEYLGHALSGAISNENQTVLFNKIMQTETGKYLEKAFEEDEDYRKLKKGSFDYKEEMIANYIERAFETETKAKNFIQQLGSLNQLVGNKTLFERLLDLFKGTKSFKNNNAIFGEYTKLLNNFLKASSSLNKTSRIFTIAEKLKEGKKLTEAEKKFYEKYKNAVDAAKEVVKSEETTKRSKNDDVRYSKYIDNGVYEIDGKNFRVNRNYDGTYEIVEDKKSKDKIVKKFDNFEEAAAYINKNGKRITAKVGRYTLGDSDKTVEVRKTSKGKHGYEVIINKAEVRRKVKGYNRKGEEITKDTLAEYGKKIGEYKVDKDTTLILDNLIDIQTYLDSIGAKYIETEEKEFGANRTGEVKSFDTEEEMLKYLESEGVKVEGKIKNIYDSNSYRYFINKDAKTGKLNVKKVFEHEIKPIEVEASDSELEAADHKELAGIDTKKTIYVNKDGKVFWIKIKGVYNVEYKVKNSDKVQVTKNATEDQVQKMQSDKSLEVLKVTKAEKMNEVQTKGESKVMSDKEAESYLYNQSTNFSNNRADVATQKLYPTTYVLTNDGKTFFQVKVRETRKGYYEVMRDNNSPMWTTEKNVTYAQIMKEVNSYKYHATNGDVEGLKKHIQFLKKMERAEKIKEAKANKKAKQELAEQKAEEQAKKPQKEKNSTQEQTKGKKITQEVEKNSKEKKSHEKKEKPKEEKLNRKLSAKTKEGEEIKVSRTTEEKLKENKTKQEKVVDDQDVEVISSEKIKITDDDFVVEDNRTADQIKDEAEAHNERVYTKTEVENTVRNITAEILKIAKLVDGTKSRVRYNEQTMTQVSDRIFRLINSKNVSAQDIVNELSDIFTDVKLELHDGNAVITEDLKSYLDVDLMKNVDIANIVKGNIQDLLKGGKATKIATLKRILKEVRKALKGEIKQLRYTGERLAVFNNQRKRIKNILRRYAKITNMDVSKVGFTALLEPFEKLHRRGLAYNATDFVESLEKVLEQYDAAKWQENYPDLRYNPEIRANLEMLLEATRSGKLVGGELMQKCTDTIDMIFEEIKKAEMDYTEKVLPSVNQTISVLKQNRYGQNKNVIAGLFRSYKRGFAPAYVVLEQILGGNSTLARKLTYEYQAELNKKQLYTGAYHDEINKKLKEFGLKKTFDSKTFDIDGHTLTADQAMNLYISLNTQANYDAINEDGAVYKDSKTRVNKEIAKKGEAEQLKQKINNILPEEYKKFADWLLTTMNSSVKREYIKWYEDPEKGFGKFQMRNEIGEIGQNTYWTLNRAYNFMNNGEKGGKNPSAYFQNSKSRTKGGDNEIMIGGAISTFDGYIDGLGAEMYTKPVYRDALRLLNTKNADGVSVMDVLSKTVDSKDVQYVRDTMADMVGKLNNERNLLDKFVGSFSIAKLSLNVGSMLKQFASAFTSNIPIRKTTKALLNKMFQNQDYKSEYKELVDEIGGLKYREKNKGIVEANADSMFGIAEKVARVGMIGISKVDLFTVSTGVYSLIAIGQDQFGYKIGTEENKNFVKEHWTEYELSQIGNTPLSKNAITRGDSLVRYIFGFLQGANRAALGSQLHKFGLWERNRKVDGEKLKADRDAAKVKFEKAETEYKAEFERVNNSEVEVDETTLEDLREKYIDAKTEYEDIENRVKDYDSYLIAGGKNIPVNMAAGILAQGVLIALVNALMKRIKGKKDWDELDVAEEGMALAMAIGVDWIPFVNTISNVVKGYEVTVPAVELFNQFSSIFKNAKIGNANSTIRQIAILLGDLTGIPVQTIYQYIYGAVKTFDPEIAYEMNSVLYGSSLQSATKTLKNYADKGKTKKTETMVGIIMKNYKTGSTTDAINKEMARLYTSGYSVLPTTALTQYTNENGEVVKLTNEQINQFKQYYNGATKEASNLLNLTDYKYASDENKAKAIKKLYDAYYQYAKYKVVGNETSNKLVKILALTNGNVNLAKYIVSMQKIAEITDTARKTRKELVIQYVNRLRNMSSQEKALLLYLAGFSVAGNSKTRLKNYLVSKGASRKDVIALLGK